jgi:hypothetical protein
MKRYSIYPDENEHERKIVTLLGNKGELSAWDIAKELKEKRLATIYTATKELMKRDFVKVNRKIKNEKNATKKLLWLTRQGIGWSLLCGSNPKNVLENSKKYNADPFSLMFIELYVKKPEEMNRIMKAGFLPDKVLSVTKDVISIFHDVIQSFKDHPEVFAYAKENNHPEFDEFKEIILGLN